MNVYFLRYFGYMQFKTHIHIKLKYVETTTTCYILSPPHIKIFAYFYYKSKEEM